MPKYRNPNNSLTFLQLLFIEIKFIKFRKNKNKSHKNQEKRNTKNKMASKHRISWRKKVVKLLLKNLDIHLMWWKTCLKKAD